LQECVTLGGCPTGSAKITKGYKLPAKYVIHAVGPVWYGGNRNEPKLLAGCYRHSLELAVENKVRSIAFPAISCGVYHFPIVQAAQIAVNEVVTFLDNNKTLGKVIFACFDDAIQKAIETALEARQA